MATLIALGQEIWDTKDGNHFVVSRINHDGGTNVVPVPMGVQSAAHLVLSGETAGTVTLTTATVEGVTVDVVQVAGGSSGECYILSRHVGSAAGAGARGYNANF